MNTDYNVQCFCNMMSALSFYPLINIPTRVTSTTKSTIDNIFCNDIQNEHKSGVLMADISDHYPIFGIRKHSPANNITAQTFRNFSAANTCTFHAKLQSEQWHTVYNSQEPQIAYDEFTKLITKHYNESFPMKSKFPSKRDANHWVTPALRVSFKTKNKLYIRYKKVPILFNEIEYKKYSKLLKSLMLTAKKTYFHSQIDNNKHDIKKTWNILKECIGSKSRHPEINSLIAGDSVTHNKAEIAESLNEYFVDVGPSLDSNIPASAVNPTTYLRGVYRESFFLHPASLVEVKNCLSNLKKSSAAGHDDLKPLKMKEAAEHLAPPLQYLINLFFDKSSLPNELKFAYVTPIHKGGDPTLPCNYRPISVLPVFSKLFERLLHNRLYSFFEKHNIINPSQYGFRKKFSTEMALLTSIEKITSSLDSGQNVIGLFLDLKKAFDTVNIPILLSKLEFYGIRGNPLSLIKNYMSDRTQKVHLNKTNSSLKTTVCGVPQGSILGPLLFILYINDLNNALQHAFPIMYADDTNIFLSGKSLPDMTESFNQDLSRVHAWLVANRLSLNITKTHSILFTLNTRMRNSKLNLKLNDVIIDTVKETNFLGVKIDNALTWSGHVTHVCKKIAKSTGIIKKVSKLLPTKTLCTLYNALIYPYLTYCHLIWGKAAKVHLERILLAQKRVVRIICNTDFLAHTNPLFKDCKILKIHDLYTLNCSVFSIKLKSNRFPASFSSQFLPILTKPQHSYRTRSQTLNAVIIPTFRTSVRQTSLLFQAPKIINEVLLPHGLFEMSIKIVKIKLKEILSNEYT